MRSALLALVAAAVLLGACPSSQSSRCKQLCQRQIECIDQTATTDIRIDENECRNACGVLERASDGKKRVDEFAECVANAETCEAILSCQ